MDDKLLEQVGHFIGQNRAEILALTDHRIEKAADVLRDDIDGKRQELLDRVESLNNQTADELGDKIKDLTAKHVEEINALTEQIKAQEVFEAQLTQRLSEIKDGEKGAQGEQGDAGEDGLDRPLVEPVELVSKDYPKSTVGTFDNGLWIATKDTIGCPGDDPQAWHCMLDAMTTMSIDLLDDRRFKLSVRMSSGQQLEDVFDIPYPEHKGIWEEGDYKKGDIVTKGSSMWLAQEDTSGQPPGNGWQQILTAPRGKQGPSGKSIVGPQGKPGRNGADAVLPENFVDDVMALAAQRRAFEDGRSRAEAITSFRGYFAPSESYRSGDVVNFDGGLYLCVSGGTFNSIAASQDSWELMLGVPKFSTPAYMLWKGEWVSGQQYLGGHVVRDGEWTMVALTKTTDRAAPQAIGAPVNGYSGADPTTQDLAKQLIQGAIYTALNPVWINGYRIYAITGNSYAVYSVNAANEISPIVEFTATVTGWQDFRLSPIPITDGTEFALISIVQEPDQTPTTFTGNWNYDTPNNPAIPPAGTIIHANSETSVLRVAKTDNDGGDRTADLDGLEVGDIIDSGNIRWTIQTIADNGSWYAFGIAPATQDAPDGVREFTFETVEATPITYLSDPDYYLGNASISGLLGVDIPIEDIVADDNAYGVDITVQAASISPDWDMVAYSAAAGDSGQALSQVEEQWVRESAQLAYKSYAQTTDDDWTLINTYTPNIDAATVGSLVFEGKRIDDWGIYYAEYRVIVENNNGDISADETEIIEHSTNNKLKVRARESGNDVLFEVRGDNNEDWRWKLVTFYNEVNP